MATRTRATGALLLTPGASATRDHPQLVAVEAALAPDGWVVERIDLARGRRPAALVEVVAAAAADLAARTGLEPGRVLLGGRSMGGRVCSMAAADGLACGGLVLISYPLRPPGRPDKLEERTAHLGRLDVPCLFVSGTRDAFGAPAELEAATQAVPGPVTHRWIEGGDHGLRRSEVEVAQIVHEWVGSLR